MSARDLFAACASIARGEAGSSPELEHARRVHVAGSGDGSFAALASVARRRGSLPMSASAKMLVTSDGRRLGTVGGGCLEAEVIERALEVARSAEPAVSEHTLNAELAGDYGLTCGGTALMFIEPVYRDPVLAGVYTTGEAMLARGEHAVVATALDWSGGVQKVLAAAGTRTGNGGERLIDAVSRISESPDDQRWEDGVFAERLSGPPPLVVFGAGHVGARVAEAAAFAGWRVTIVDDRPDFADPSRFPFAKHVVVAPFHELPASLPLGSDACAVVATRGHQHDALIVEQLAMQDLRYLGMLGSRRKVALTWKLLEQSGIPRERLERIHAPVGLSIGADTPEEIAVSIVAQMIAIRRRREVASEPGS